MPSVRSYVLVSGEIPPKRRQEFAKITKRIDLQEIQLTKGELVWLHKLYVDGFITHNRGWGRNQGNKCLGSLCQKGLAHFGMGPPNDMFQWNCFLPGPDPETNQI